MTDMSLIFMLQKILSNSGYRTSLGACDEDGYSHKLIFTSENNAGEIHTYRGQVIFVKGEFT